MKTTTHSLSTIVLLAVTACSNARSNAAIDEVEINYDSGNQARIEYSYADGRLLDVSTYFNDELRETIDVSYDGDKLSETRISDDEWVENTSLVYLDDQLVSLDSTNSDDESWSVDLEYRSGRLTRVEQLIWDAEEQEETKIDLSYDSDNRLQTFEVRPSVGSAWTRSYSFADGDLVRVVDETNGDRRDTDLSYDASGRLARVDVEGTRYRLSYDRRGRVEHIEGPSAEITVRYSEDPVIGFSFEPGGGALSFPGSRLIDSNGRTFEDFDGLQLVAGEILR